MADTTIRTLQLDEGFTRGDETITEIKLRRPSAGELRGLSVVDLVRQEYAAVETLVPRITTPIVLKEQVQQLSPADLLAVSAEIASFFLTRKQAAEAGLEA